MTINKELIDNIIKYTKEHLENQMYFSNSNNSNAVITEILSNLTIYLRSKNVIEDLLVLNLIDNYEDIEEYFEEIIYNNDMESIETLLELSFFNNLTANKIIKNNIDVIDSSSINYLTPADGVSFVNDNEIIISYASTSYETKRKNNEIIKEISSAIDTLNNENKLLYLKLMNIVLEEYKKELFNSKIYNNLSFTEKLHKITELKRDILKTLKTINNKTIENDILPHYKKLLKPIFKSRKIDEEKIFSLIDEIKKENKKLKKDIKISINDTLFNTKEMFKIFLEIRDSLKSDKVNTIVFENISTGNSLKFNKKTMEQFNKIYKDKFDIIDNTFIKKDHTYFQEKQFLEILLNSKYIEHFNINAEKKIDEKLIKNRNYENIMNYLNNNEELKTFIIEKGFYEDYQLLTDNYFSKLFLHLKTIKIFYDAKEVFNIDSLSDVSNEKFLKELHTILKLDSKYNELNVMLSLKFFKTVKNLFNDELSKHIITLVGNYINAKLNRYYKNISKEEQKKLLKIVNSILTEEEIYFNKKSNFFTLNENFNNLNYSSNEDILEQMNEGHSLAGLNLDESFFEVAEDTDKIGELYFSDFIKDNKELDEREKQQLINNFLLKTFDGNESTAITHALTDTVVDTNFASLKTESKNRLESFFKKVTDKEKYIFIVVDYDNDGTISGMIAESLKSEIQNSLGRSYENGENVHIIYTKNDNNTRGYTFNDIKDKIETLEGDIDCFLITADNGTSNIEEIEKTLKTKKVKNCNITWSGAIISDHHPMESDKIEDIKSFYEKNIDKILLFNPEYQYVIKDKKLVLDKSNNRNVSGATTFLNVLSFITPEQKKEYLENLTKISNLLDYVDIKHPEINDPQKINEYMQIGKRINIYQKFTIYFNNILNSLDNKAFKDIETLRNEINNLEEPINNLGLIFLNNFVEYSIYKDDLFNNAIKDKKQIINLIFEELKRLQLEYLKTVLKDPDNIQEIDTMVVKLIKIFEDKSFDMILKNMKNKVMLYNSQNKKTENFNIEEVVIEDKNRKVVMYIDNSIPAMPRKLLMDVMRYKQKEHYGIIIYANDMDKVINGSARVNGNYNLTNFKFYKDGKVITPKIKGHKKAAGFEMSKEDLEKIKNGKYYIVFDEDKDSLIQNIIFHDVKDFETTLNSINKITNKKTGGLDYQYLISIKDIGNVGISLERFFSPQLKFLNKIDEEYTNIKYEEVIKNHKNYEILLDFHTSLKLNVSGYLLKEIIKRLDKNEEFYLNFKYFNNTFMLENILTKDDLEKQSNSYTFNYKKEYEKDTKDTLEYKKTIEELKEKGNITKEFVEVKLIDNVVSYNIDIEKVKSSKKRNLKDIPFLSEFKNVLKSFGLYDVNDIKSFKEHVKKLEEYYTYMYNTTRKTNFVVTDTETNGLAAHLTQVGFVVLNGEIVNGKWKLKNIKNLTTLVKYDDKFGLSPAIKKLTKIDEDMMINYGTDFKKIGDIFYNELPDYKESVLIAHNLPFDSGVLRKNGNEKFAEYVRNVAKFDTARISKITNSTGAYQLMTKIYVFNEDTTELQYLGVVPESINSINAKILNKNRIDGTVLELKTITGNKIVWIGDKITITSPSGSKMTYFGNLVSKEGHDIKKYSVEQNILNIFLSEAKELIKKDKGGDKDKKLYNEIVKYFSNEVFAGRWSDIEPSSKINKTLVMNIIKNEFINPYYKSSLLLTKEQRDRIYRKINYDINLYKYIVRILDKKEPADKFFNIYRNENLSEIEKIKLYKQEVLPLIKDKINETIYPFIKVLDNIDIDNITPDDVVNFENNLRSQVPKLRYNELEKFFVRPEPAKKMMIKIFEDNKDLNLLFNNTRQQKEFLKAFTKHLSEINEINFNNNKKKIKNFIKEKEDLNSISMDMKDKITLFKYFIELNKNPYFELSINELHNNFNPYGDVSIESLILPEFYLKRLEDYNETKRKEIFNEVFFKSNLTDLAADIREIKFNSSTNNFMYFMSIQDNNFIIEKDGLLLKLKVDDYEVDMKLSIEDIKKDLPNMSKDIIEIINKYNNTDNKKDKKEYQLLLKSMFSFNDNIDISLNYHISTISDDIAVTRHINKVLSDISKLIKNYNKKIARLPEEEQKLFFDIFKELYKETVTKELKENSENVIFDKLLVEKLNKWYPDKIEIKLSDNKEICKIKIKDILDENNKSKDININLNTKFLLGYSKTLASLNSLLKDKDIDIYDFNEYEKFKTKLYDISKKYIITKEKINKKLNNVEIYRNNIAKMVKNLLIITGLDSKMIDKKMKLRIVGRVEKAIIKYKELDKKNDYIDNLLETYLSKDDNYFIRILKEDLKEYEKMVKNNNKNNKKIKRKDIGKMNKKPNEYIDSKIV